MDYFLKKSSFVLMMDHQLFSLPKLQFDLLLLNNNRNYITCYASQGPIQVISKWNVQDEPKPVGCYPQVFQSPRMKWLERCAIVLIT